MSNLLSLAFIITEIGVFTQTDMAKTTRFGILIKCMYVFPYSNLVYPLQSNSKCYAGLGRA